MGEGSLAALAPLLVTLLLAFATRSALVAMLAGVFAGAVLLGGVPAVSLNSLLQRSLASEDFIWICQIVLLIGVLFEQFRRTQVLAALAQRFAQISGNRRRVEVSAWGMGFVIVDDYFSPLLTGSVIRPLSDRARIPREKLAFILDSTTASVCILVPFTAWGAYVAGLIAAAGEPVAGVEEGLAIFIGAIKYNFYALLLVLFTLLIALRVIPDFGPMRRAEQRVATGGPLVREGGKPLAGDDGDLPDSARGRPASLLLELLVPVLLLVGVGAWTLIAFDAVKIVEAFMVATTWMFVVMAVRGDFGSVAEAGEVVVAGAKNVLEALLIVALAYALNAVTIELGAGDYIVAHFADGLSPNSLVALTFVLTASISFATGTSWGAFAMMMPVALPVAFAITNGAVEPLVYQVVAAVAGGGIFGDHSSPVSDTSVLASVGAGSDHIDHVITQLPYALLVAGITVALYLVI